MATGFGVGFLPFSPGTFGSVLGLPLAWGLQQLPGWPWYAVAHRGTGTYRRSYLRVAARHLGGLHDPGSVVFDAAWAWPRPFSCSMPVVSSLY